MNECCRQTLRDVADSLSAGARVIPWYAKLIGAGDFLRRVAVQLRTLSREAP